MRKQAYLIIAILILLLCISLTGALFDSNPILIPSNNDTSPITTDNIYCFWEVSGDVTAQNASWYKDGVLNQSYVNTASPSKLNSSFTSRGEVWTCNVTIANGTDSTSYVVNTTIKNAAPSVPIVRNSTNFDIGNYTNLTEDTFYTFTVNSIDADGDSITYTIIPNTLFNSTFDTATGVFTWQPDYPYNGSNNIRFIATDDYGGTPVGISAKIVNFYVVLRNDPPYFTSTLSYTCNQDSACAGHLIAGDEENNIPIKFWANESFINMNLSGFFNFTPTRAQSIFWRINITINDSLNASAAGIMTINISPVNSRPNLSFIPNQTGTQGQLFNLTINATDIDFDNISFAITSINCSVANPWTIRWLNFTNDTVNNYSIVYAIINYTLNNSHVVCSWANITASDPYASVWQTVFFNITNTNDPPIIYNYSIYSENSRNNYYTYNLSGAKGISFRYRINATDPDLLVTGANEEINYTINETSLFTINLSSGLITNASGIDDSYIGNHTYIVTVTDKAGLTANATINIGIINNTAPWLNFSTNVTCLQNSTCKINITVIDPEGGPFVFTYASNTNHSISTYNITNVSEYIQQINFFASNSEVGNHLISISVEDPPGSYDFNVLNFSVLNINDAPFFDSDFDLTRDNITFPRIVATHTVSYYLNASDLDLLVPAGFANESLTFNWSNMSVNPSSFFSMTKIGEKTALILFSPNISDVGNYSINISVTDANGSVDWEIINFTVYNRTSPPAIVNITPFGTPASNYTVFAWNSTSNFPNNITSVNLTENTTVVFNQTSTYDETLVNNLTYKWYYDSALNSTNRAFTKSFDFFSSGTHTLTFMVFDDSYENASFTWGITVANVNRAPVLITYLTNFTGANVIQGRTTESSYFYGGLDSSTRKFIDPDNDINGDNSISGNETNNLTFSVGSSDCASYASFSFDGTKITISPIAEGTCNITFNATDSDDAVTESNIVIVEVANITETKIPEVIYSSGGGGGSSTRQIAIPLPEEVDKPVPLKIIVPKGANVYQNQTIKIPITIKNTWNETLTGITLFADTNVTNVSLVFSLDYIPVLLKDDFKETMLEVSNYRSEGPYEINVHANVTDPAFHEVETILINSIEQKQDAEDVQIKIAFARDLLKDNPECMELNEIILRAENEMTAGNYEKSLEMLDSVINGCKYLVSNLRKFEETPAKPSILELLGTAKYLNYFAIGLGVLLFLLIFFLIFRKKPVPVSQV